MTDEELITRLREQAEPQNLIAKSVMLLAANRIEQLQKKPEPTYIEPWEDRMGGQFTQEELLEAERNRW